MDRLLSVVIPAYNCASYLAATLDSLRQQDLRDWECIVVDDGSTDDTAAVADRFVADSRFRVLRQRNGDVSRARNSGFLASSPSRYVMFGDADDLWLPGALGTLVAAAEEDVESVGSHCLAEKVDATGDIIKEGWFASTQRERRGWRDGQVRDLPGNAPTDFAVLVEKMLMFPPGTVLLRRNVVELVGRFDTRLSGAEDYDYFARVARHGHFAFVPRVLLHYRQDGNNMSLDRKMAEETWTVRRKIAWSHANNPAQRRVAVATWRSYQRAMWSERRSLAHVAAARRDAPALTRNLARAGVSGVRWCAGRPRPLFRRDQRW